MSEFFSSQQLPKHIQTLLNLFVEVKRAIPSPTESRLLVFFGNPPERETRNSPISGCLLSVILLFGLYIFIFMSVEKNVLLGAISSLLAMIAVGFLAVIFEPSFKESPVTQSDRPQFEISLNRLLKTLLVMDHVFAMSSQAFSFSALREIEIQGNFDETYSKILIKVILRINDFEIVLDNKPLLPIHNSKHKLDFNVLFLRNVLSMSEWCCCPLRFSIENSSHIIFDQSMIPERSIP
ncbi:hypothetical protein HYY75_07265 [bacterium]|nr:hypothetical protein [bacterium]